MGGGFDCKPEHALLIDSLPATLEKNSYYSNGLLSDRTDARNITTHYTYDTIDRPWTISYNDGATPGITYGYDQNGVSVCSWPLLTQTTG